MMIVALQDRVGFLEGEEVPSLERRVRDLERRFPMPVALITLVSGFYRSSFGPHAIYFGLYAVSFGLRAVFIGPRHIFIGLLDLFL